jgi:hypothetical protein
MTKPKKVLYSGTRRMEGRTDQIIRAQQTVAFTIRGKSFPRIRHGEGDHDWEADPCHDCAALKGEFHVHGCDAEECPCCGGQLIGCHPPDE